MYVHFFLCYGKVLHLQHNYEWSNVHKALIKEATEHNLLGCDKWDISVFKDVHAHC